MWRAAHYLIFKIAKGNSFIYMMSRFDLYNAKTKRDFLSPENISRHLKCSICHDVFEDPVRTACG